VESRSRIALPYSETVAPIGKVMLEYLPDGSKHITLFFAGEHIRPEAQTGIAIDGSALMRPWFGSQLQPGKPNLVAMAAQKVAAYLARRVDDDGSTSLIYWGTGPDGANIELVGDLTAYQVEQYPFDGPTAMGSKANLLPAVRYFVERFAQAKWGMYVFFTQGIIEDLEAVKNYTTSLAAQITAGQRNELKLVLIGVGKKINQVHLEALDNLDTGTALDLWDYRIAPEMRDVLELFTELGDSNTIICPSGKVMDSSGNVVADYQSRGLPARITFTLPAGVRSFSVEMEGKQITQQIP
jgi:hypothetical protein